MHKNSFAPTASNGYVSDEDLRVLAEDSREVGAAAGTPAATAVITVPAAYSAAVGDACPTTACTERC